VEIDPFTYEFAKSNLERAGVCDVVLIQEDGGLGYPELGPYDGIAVTSACSEIPRPLIEQLKVDGRLIASVIKAGGQDLMLLEKRIGGIHRCALCEVL
jgi:protein-L-isoaspartate(D-aspartate) O-methyltransferase